MHTIKGLSSLTINHLCGKIIKGELPFQQLVDFCDGLGADVLACPKDSLWTKTDMVLFSQIMLQSQEIFKWDRSKVVAVMVDFVYLCAKGVITLNAVGVLCGIPEGELDSTLRKFR